MTKKKINNKFAIEQVKEILLGYQLEEKDYPFVVSRIKEYIDVLDDINTVPKPFITELFNKWIILEEINGCVLSENFVQSLSDYHALIQKTAKEIILILDKIE